MSSCERCSKIQSFYRNGETTKNRFLHHFERILTTFASLMLHDFSCIDVETGSLRSGFFYLIQMDSFLIQSDPVLSGFIRFYPSKFVFFGFFY